MEEVDVEEEEDIHSVLAQESTEISCVLLSQQSVIVRRLCILLLGDGHQHVHQLAVTTSSQAGLDCVREMLGYLGSASVEVCRRFLQSMCMLCDNIPMHLETRLMSAAGNTPAVESPYSGQDTIKRQRIDHWGNYSAAVKTFLLQRWERLSACLDTDIQPENVWVGRQVNRIRERPDQTPAAGDRGNRTPASYRDYGALDARVTLESFLQNCAGQVSVLLGPPGSGKTLVMSCLGRHWAQDTGPIPSSYLLILLEFRQLNLVSKPLSLSQLLFQYYLPPQGGNDEKEAVLDYLLSNPEHSCWMLDGYDEFHSKIRAEPQQATELFDSQRLLPIAELISALLSRQILPGCTLVVTCRERHVSDLEGIANNVALLQGWDDYTVKEYVDRFFAVKGQGSKSAVGEQALDLLLSSRHLRAMSAVPALCHLCCICLEHILLAGSEEDRRTEGRNVRNERNGPSSPLPLPATRTQIYLTVLTAFLSRGSNSEVKRRRSTTDIITPALSSMELYGYWTEVLELSTLAWKGLEESRTLFMKSEVSQHVLNFSIRAGLFTQVEVRSEDGTLGHAYCFVHVTLQEFLAALKIMTSDDVTDTQLKNRFNLTSRWTTRVNPKTVFTDSLPMYMCGLTAPHCSEALRHAVGRSAGAQTLVQSRQHLVLERLKKWCIAGHTGPKLLQLCHCVQETENKELAKNIVCARPVLELRNILLLPRDIDALVFVVGSADDKPVGLDFGACSIELDCLDILASCENINCLTFRSRKYDDKFAEKLSSILPKLQVLRKLEYTGASLTHDGAFILASALQSCPVITEINLSDNNLKERGIRDTFDVLARIPSLAVVMLGCNCRSPEVMNYLIEKVADCINIDHIFADGMKEIKVTFSQTSETSLTNTSDPVVSLVNQAWSRAKMHRLGKSLLHCSALSVLDLSGDQMDLASLRALTEFLPHLNITKHMIVKGSSITVEGLEVMTALMSSCPAVIELDVKCSGTYQLTTMDNGVVNPDSVCAVFSGGAQQQTQDIARKLCLSCRNLRPADMEKVWRCLGHSCDIAVLDLSINLMGYKCLKKLLGVLPQLRNIQEINLSERDISMADVLQLAGAFHSHHNLAEVHIRDSGRNVKLKFDKSANEIRYKTFRVTCSTILPNNMYQLCSKLVQCPSPLVLDFSHNTLGEASLNKLVTVLPRMKSLLNLNVSHSVTCVDEALVLVSCLTHSERVRSVELSLTAEERFFICFEQDRSSDKTLSLRNCSMEDDHLSKLAKIVRSCPGLTKLELRNNGLVSRSIEDLVTILDPGDRKLLVSVEEHWVRSEAAVDLVVHCLNCCRTIRSVRVQQTTLHLTFNSYTSGNSTDPVYYMSAEKIGFVDCAVEGRHLLAIGSILNQSPLVELDLSQNTLGNEVPEFLSSVLPSLSRLATLSLSGHEISDSGAETLATTFRMISGTLKSIDLSHCHGWTASGGKALITSLMHCDRLEALCLDSFHLDDDCSMYLARGLPKTSSLRRLNLNNINTGRGPSGVKGLLQAMEGLQQMEEIELDSWIMGDEGVEQLISLPQWTNLTKISLSKNNISDQSGEKLMDALKLCNQLEELHLSSNCVGERTAARMALVLPSLTHLTVLDVSQNSLGSQGCISLSMALPKMKNLTKLHLTSIQTSELCVVAASLAYCPHIQEVSMGWNNCGDDVAVELARVMLHCQRLTRLDLESNCISAFGAEALLRMLPFCPALQLIRLWRNPVSSSEIQTLKRQDWRLNFLST